MLKQGRIVLELASTLLTVLQVKIASHQVMELVSLIFSEQNVHMCVRFIDLTMDNFALTVASEIPNSHNFGIHLLLI